MARTPFLAWAVVFFLAATTLPCNAEMAVDRASDICRTLVSDRLTDHDGAGTVAEYARDNLLRMNEACLTPGRLAWVCADCTSERPSDVELAATCLHAARFLYFQLLALAEQTDGMMPSALRPMLDQTCTHHFTVSEDICDSSQASADKGVVHMSAVRGRRAPAQEFYLVVKPSYGAVYYYDAEEYIRNGGSAGLDAVGTVPLLGSRPAPLEFNDEGLAFGGDFTFTWPANKGLAGRVKSFMTQIHNTGVMHADDTAFRACKVNEYGVWQERTFLVVPSQQSVYYLKGSALPEQYDLGMFGDRMFSLAGMEMFLPPGADADPAGGGCRATARFCIGVRTASSAGVIRPWQLCFDTEQDRNVAVTSFGRALNNRGGSSVRSYLASPHVEEDSFMHTLLAVLHALHAEVVNKVIVTELVDEIGLLAMAQNHLPKVALLKNLVKHLQMCSGKLAHTKIMASVMSEFHMKISALASGAGNAMAERNGVALLGVPAGSPYLHTPRVDDRVVGLSGLSAVNRGDNLESGFEPAVGVSPVHQMSYSVVLGRLFDNTIESHTQAYMLDRTDRPDADTRRAVRRGLPLEADSSSWPGGEPADFEILTAESESSVVHGAVGTSWRPMPTSPYRFWLNNMYATVSGGHAILRHGNIDYGKGDYSHRKAKQFRAWLNYLAATGTIAKSPSTGVVRVRSLSTVANNMLMPHDVAMIKAQHKLLMTDGGAQFFGAAFEVVHVNLAANMFTALSRGYFANDNFAHYGDTVAVYERWIAEDERAAKTPLALAKVKIAKSMLGLLYNEGGSQTRLYDFLQLALLDMTLGVVSAVNCKSGLDRTGWVYSLHVMVAQIIEMLGRDKVETWKAVADLVKKDSFIQTANYIDSGFSGKIQKYEEMMADGTSASVRMPSDEYSAYVNQECRRNVYRPECLVSVMRVLFFTNVVNVGFKITSYSTGIPGFKWMQQAAVGGTIKHLHVLVPPFLVVGGVNTPPQFTKDATNDRSGHYQTFGYMNQPWVMEYLYGGSDYRGA